MEIKMFLGSSSEQLSLLDRWNVMLQKVFQERRDRRHTLTTISWDSAFPIGQSTVTTIYEKASEVAAAMFLFAADDWTSVRNNLDRTVRDNVVFEFGVFVGRLGLARTILVQVDHAKLPSDLNGLTVVRADLSDATIKIEANRIVSQIIAEVEANPLLGK